MEQSEDRNDAHVFTGPGVPRIFEDAYAVNVDGTLKVLRWSTRQQPKRHPIAEYAPGCWEHYEHQGEQGDEVVEQPKQPEPPRPAPRRARPPRDLVEHGDGSRSWTPEPDPDSPGEREAEIRSREPGAPENLQPAVVRPSLPPRDFAVPTHQLPQRIPGSADRTEVLPVVRTEPSQQTERQSGRPNRRGRTRGSWSRGGGAWLALAVTALSALAAIH